MSANIAPAWHDRAMTASDIPAVVAMERQACLHPVHAWSADNYRSSMESGYWMRVRCDAGTGRIVAVCVAMTGLDEMHLLNIAVDRECQGLGLARAMLESLYEECRRSGARALWLEVRLSNERARNLYHRQGFIEVGVRRRYYPAPEGREDALVMRWQHGDEA